MAGAWTPPETVNEQRLDERLRRTKEEETEHPEWGGEKRSSGASKLQLGILLCQHMRDGAPSSDLSSNTDSVVRSVCRQPALKR